MNTIFGVRAVFGVSVSLGDKSANGSQTLFPEVNRRSVSNGEVQSNDEIESNFFKTDEFPTYEAGRADFEIRVLMNDEFDEW